MTGLVFETALGLHDKRLQLLKEALPRASRVAYLADAQGFRPPSVVGCNGELVNTSW